MDWQLPVVAGLLTVAVGYVARSAWRTWFGAVGCAAGCGGCAKPAAGPDDRRRIALPRV